MINYRSQTILKESYWGFKGWRKKDEFQQLITSSDGFQQLLNEPTYIQKNSSPCIDLIFTDQLPNMSANYGVYASLHRNCHHQIVHARFNLHITYPLPPPPTPHLINVWYGITKRLIHPILEKSLTWQIAKNVLAIITLTHK